MPCTDINAKVDITAIYARSNRLMKNETLENLIYPVVEEFSQSLPKSTCFLKDPDTVVFGSEAALDSLSMISFIVALEERIEFETGITVRLVNEKAMSMRNSPFRTLNSLAIYIDELLAENVKH